LAFYFMDSLIEDGLWISQTLLRLSPSLESLQGLADFEQRVEKFGNLQIKEQSQLLPLLTLRKEGLCENKNEPCPLLVGLHADREIALDSIKYWHPIAEIGWLVGIPQSSQALWSGAYVWEDRQISRQEIDHHIKELSKKYYIDSRRVILSGHGDGGTLAAWLPLSGGVDVRGFIALNPRGSYVRDPSQWIRLLQANQPKTRGAVLAMECEIAGEEREIERFVEIFNTHHVPCKLLMIPGDGLEGNQAYEPALMQGIDFILS